MGFFTKVFSDKDKKSDKSKTLTKRPSTIKPTLPPVIPSEPIELPVNNPSSPPKPVKRPVPKQTPSEYAPEPVIPTSSLPGLSRPHPVPLALSEDSASSSSTLDSILTTESSSTANTSPNSSLPNIQLPIHLPKGSLGSFPQNGQYTAYQRPQAPPPRPPKIRSSPLAPLPDNAPNFSKIAVTPRSTPPPNVQQQRQIQHRQSVQYPPQQQEQHQLKQRQSMQYPPQQNRQSMQYPPQQYPPQQNQQQRPQQQEAYQQRPQQGQERGPTRRNSMPAPNGYYRGVPPPPQQRPHQRQSSDSAIAELPTLYNKSLRSSSTSSLTSLASTNCSITNTRRKSKDFPLTMLPRSNASGEFSHLSILSGDPLGGSFHRYPTAITSAPSSPTGSRTDLNLAPEIQRIRPLSQVQIQKPVRPSEGGKSRKRSSTMQKKKFTGGFEPTIPEEPAGPSRGKKLGAQMWGRVGGMDTMMAGVNGQSDGQSPYQQEVYSQSVPSSGFGGYNQNMRQEWQQQGMGEDRRRISVQ
ncbi:hypothetical protein BJ508DRAFT_359544 [Ascobolus immersus RN42]|uniref:Uncharacterized protein n=1 Tax=Ascobolus immersus RN42 TaxID=1160509 RepID=A0A3N4IKZ2_ASCIM|nr:hypothetical protein BJ508DRAFT_359544 [Ascobolus immersus RN42]